MLLRFSVSNWMSFRDKTTLDMVATREKQHSHHLATIKKYNFDLLPVALIYGANASGKSNLVKALNFVHRFVTEPLKAGAPIPIRTYLLDKHSAARTTDFRFELLIAEKVYAYSFSLTAERVVTEELRLLGKTSEKTLFRRGPSAGDFELSDHIQQSDELHFAFRGTHENQLYLANSVSQKLQEFKPIFDWFAESLVVIMPESRFMRMLEITNESHPQFGKMTEMLRDLDTGIMTMRQIDIPSDKLLPKDFLSWISVGLSEGQSLPLSLPVKEDGVFLHKKGGKLVVRRLAPIHRTEDGQDISFSFADESDGTRRLFDVLPAFLALENRPAHAVFVIDELDRSLHSLLTKALLGQYLSQRTGACRSQLIFTTHDTHLMTQSLFRRDEIWITERNRFGASKLVAFSEFKDVRKDKDIQRSYLQGRMGGIPRIQTISDPCVEEVNA